MKKTIYIISLLFLCSFSAFSQSDFSQPIRGQIIDQELRMPLVGANVVLQIGLEQRGCISDESGYFVLEDIPVGRHALQVSFVGYETRIISNLLLTTGKELFLEIGLQEIVNNIGEVMVLAQNDKSLPVNSMAGVSSKHFNVEETSRYAGSLNDPARMASAYAGITQTHDGDNNIVIRGNSPKGLLWRMEGVDIPNPNHFSDISSSGGAISIFSNQMMSNSDFLTGAFPAEYGNATAGVFDIHLRKGNADKREYTLEAGLMGLNLAAEGPLPTHNSSYLVNYRYSTLSILDKLGVRISGDAVPHFQDLAFKLVFPDKKSGVFSLFGLWGKSVMKTENPVQNNSYASRVNISGLSYKKVLNENTYIQATAALSQNKNIYELHQPDSEVFVHYQHNEHKNQNLQMNLTALRKFNSRHVLKVGINAGITSFDFLSEQQNRKQVNPEITLENQGETREQSAFLSWKFKVNSKITLTSGLHASTINVNNQFRAEPRLSMDWQFSPRRSVYLALGSHSQNESLVQLFYRQEDEVGQIAYPNIGLPKHKALHAVMGFKQFVFTDIQMNLEVYYQHLYDIPVVPGSHLSTINLTSGFIDQALQPNGLGKNTGIEIQVERFFAKNYYWLFSGSIYNSRYMGGDSVWYNTRFNGNYVVSILAGREFPFSVSRTVAVNLKANLAGGQRYTPIDLEKSIERGYAAYNENRVLDAKADDYFRIDLQIRYRKYYRNFTSNLTLDIQNLTNRLNMFSEQYNAAQQSIVKTRQLGLIPVLSYKIEF